MRRAFAIWLAIGAIAVLAGGVGYASLIEESRELPDVEPGGQRQQLGAAEQDEVAPQPAGAGGFGALL